MDRVTAPMKKIVARERYQGYGHADDAWTVVLKLECGHEVHRKASAEPKKQARCERCLRG